jgi:hypothetical protein
MTEQEMNNKVIERANEMLKDKKINSIYQSKKKRVKNYGRDF